ncbi:MAG: DUF4080 domain-containing protein [Treponema sp.]|nr:DUF4080 domain-containing protein [Treponema sp.]
MMKEIPRTPLIFTTLLIEKSPQALPLGAACVASALKNTPALEKACAVKLVSFCKEDEELAQLSGNDSEVARYISDKLWQAAGEKSSAIFCFSVYVWNHVILEKAARLLKEKGAACIAGGPEVTACPDTFTAFDRLITGEGEGKISRLVAEVLGISLEESTGKNGENGLANALDSYPSPYLDGTLNPAQYGGALWELARGCPFKCSYCYESKGEKRVRHFPRERLEKELDLFARLKLPQVFVLDPTYNANKKEALDLLKMIAKKTPDTFYYFEARAEFIDRELARAFTKLHCALQIGLQSSDENVLRLVNRPFNKKLFVKNIGILNDEGVIFGLDVIYGLPGDSLKGFKESVNFAISLYPNNLELFCLSVLPGTDLFDRAKELNLEYQPQPPYHILKTDKFTPQDLKRAEKISIACSCFYNQGRAVPWFNSILHSLHLPASKFFEGFYDWACAHGKEKEIRECCQHKYIEEMQKDFVREQLNQKKKGRLVTAALDIISFNGAYSRKTESGISESLTLNYPAEYIDSQYALDLEFFVENVKMRKDKIRI